MTPRPPAKVLLLTLTALSCSPADPSASEPGERRQAVYAVPVQTFVPSDPTDTLATVRFGGDRLAVAASALRAVYVYSRTGTAWSEEARVDLNGPHLAGSLAFDGTTLVVGATADGTAAAGAGAVHVYERSGSAWQRVDVLTASDAAAGDTLGTAVWVSGDDLFAASWQRGAVYYFAREAGAWVERQKLGHTHLGGASFGWRVQSDGDTLFVAQPNGGAFHYERSGSTWVERQHLDRPGGAAQFGWSVDLEGNRAAVSWRSAVTVLYERADAASSWTEVATLSPSVPQTTMGGFPSLGLGTGAIAIGSTLDDDPVEDSGAVFAFSERGGAWAESERILSPNPTFQGRFGVLDVAGTLLAATGNDELYLFELTPKGDLAAPCSEARQCASGNCADGVCCDAACAAPCEACVTGATGEADGTCAPVLDGADPRDDCADPAAGSCGPDGWCDGAGACRTAAPAGSPCGPATCDNRQRTTTACDGSGVCAPTTESCGDYTCEGDSCRTSCSTDEHCAPSFRCADAVCVAPGRCSDDLSEAVSGDGTRTACAPYTCLTATCQTRCASSSECAAGFVCDTSSARCVDTSTTKSPRGSGDDGGCGCRAPGAAPRHGAGAGLLATLGLLLVLARRRGLGPRWLALLLLGCSPAEAPVGTASHTQPVVYVDPVPAAVLGDQTAPTLNPQNARVIVVGDVMVASLGKSVEVRRLNGADWELAQTIVAPPGSVSFAECLDFDGSTIVVGDPERAGSVNGALHVYSLVGTTWAPSAVIADQTGLASLGQGHCKVLGDTLAAFGRLSSANRVGIFERAGGTWTNTQTLDVASEPEWYVDGIAIDTDRLLVLQREGIASSGLAHFYRKEAGGWVSDGSLAPPAPCRVFRAAAIAADRAVVGTVGCTETLTARRAVGAWTWAASAPWVAPSPARPEASAVSAAFHTDMLVVGYGYGNLVDLFTESAGQWRLQQRLVPPAGTVAFGMSVSAAGSWLAVSAPTDGVPPPPRVFVYPLLQARANGQPCAGATECASGDCVEDVCCDAACSAPCTSCRGALTGGDDGTCAPVTAGEDPVDDCGLCSACDGAGGCEPATDGTDPLDDCTPDGANTCGADGFCNGTGACRAAAPEGTSCGAATCTDAQSTDPACDGVGSCVAVPTACEPYACAGSACGTDCAAGSDCADGYHCAAGVCVASGTCTTDGVSVLTSAGETSCAPYRCDEGACLRECGDTADCAPGHFCEKAGAGGSCVAASEAQPADEGCGCRAAGSSRGPRGAWAAALLVALFVMRAPRRALSARRPSSTPGGPPRTAASLPRRSPRGGGTRDPEAPRSASRTG